VQTASESMYIDALCVSVCVCHPHLPLRGTKAQDQAQGGSFVAPGTMFCFWRRWTLTLWRSLSRYTAAAAAAVADVRLSSAAAAAAAATPAAAAAAAGGH
jgi:hypothetical protein